jgi:hypothetical protein
MPPQLPLYIDALVEEYQIAKQRVASGQQSPKALTIRQWAGFFLAAARKDPTQARELARKGARRPDFMANGYNPEAVVALLGRFVVEIDLTKIRQPGA